MRGATGMLLGLAGAVSAPAAGQNFSFTTVLEGETSIPAAGGSSLVNVGQVVLQDDNAVATIGQLGTVASPVNLVSFNATPGNGAATVVAMEGQLHSTFNTSAAGEFADFNNLAAGNGLVTFIGAQNSTAGRGVFRYDAGAAQRSTIHFDGDAVSGWNGALDTGAGLPAYGVNTAGGVVFSAATVAPTTPGDQFVARFTVGGGGGGGGGGAAARIHDDSSNVTNFNYPDSFFPTRKAMTDAGHAVFVGTDDQGVRRIYDVSPGPAPTLAERTFNDGGGTYEVQRLLAASGNSVTGVTLFRAFKDRPDPQDDSWTGGALLAQSPTGLKEIGSFDTSLAFAPELTAVMSDNGRIAAYIPDTTGGHVAYYDAAAGGLVQTLGADADVGGGFRIKDISIDDGSVPMVNGNGTIVFDAVIINDANDDERHALIAWSPASGAGPVIVIKTGDTVNIAGGDKTIAQLLTNSPLPIGELAYDGEVLKDGLNENDYLAFGVRYVDESGLGAAVLLTQVPEPGMAPLLALTGATLLRARRRR